MSRTFSFLLVLVFLLGSITAAFAAQGAVPLDQRLGEVNRAIAQANAGWRAGHSAIAEMPMDDFTAMLGVDLSAPRPEGPVWRPAGPMSVPAHFDWRDVDGQNYITPVKYQGRCGSCVAFGCIGAIEAGIRIREQDPNLEVDLSEQHAFNCDFMAGCQLGSTAYTLLSNIQTSGVVDEDCFPYLSGGTGLDYQCTDACPGAANRSFKIANYSTIWGGVDAIKQAIVRGGPVTAAFYVYEDLKYYVSGVYQHVFGPMLGGHQVLLVGWDDADKCWIVKNSWSESFGEDGYFRIKWNSSGISADVTKVDVGDQAFTPGGLPGGDCTAVANHIYNTCDLAYELEDQTLTADAFQDYCNGAGFPQCVHTCHEQHAECNRLAGCIGFCTDQWCAMDFEYLYEACGLSVALETGSPLPKAEAIALCEEVGYSSNAMKCILECIPQTSNCPGLAACMTQCPLCSFPTVDFTADVIASETAPLTVTFTRNVSYPEDCGRTITHWDFGDGTTSYDPSDVIKHTYKDLGVYSVELRVTNEAGPGIKFAENLIQIVPAADDDTADDDAADDDALDDDAADDDLGDDDLADDDAADDDDDDDDDDDNDDDGCGC